MIGFNAPSPAAISAASTAPWIAVGGVPGTDVDRIAIDPNTMLLGANTSDGMLLGGTNGGTTFTAPQLGGIDESLRAIAFSPKKGSGVAFAFSNRFN
jgi:hypothetical protein